MKYANIAGSLAGIIFTLLAVYSLQVTSVMAFVLFSLWAGTPFVFTLVLSFSHAKKQGLAIAVYGSLLTCLLLFLDITYWHPDPQGGIVVLGLPIVLYIVIFGALAFSKK